MKNIHNYVFQQHFTYQGQSAESFSSLDSEIFLFSIYLFLSPTFLCTFRFFNMKLNSIILRCFLFFCTTSIIHTYFFILCY